jgi:peptide/nickel transport system permease protein
MGTVPPSVGLPAVWRQLQKNPLALAGGVVILLLAAVAVTAPVLAPYDPAAYDVKRILLPPSREHLLGTDQIGRDVLSRMLYGARVSLAVGFVAVGIAVAIGMVVGVVAGYYGGATDTVIMLGVVDVMLTFPRFFLLLAVIAMLQPSIFVIMAVIGVTGWMGVARLVRAEVLSLKEREFVVSARALGARDLRLMFRHILPNALVPVLVSAILGVAGAVLTEAGLSFLGLGVQPPTPAWGHMLGEGRLYLLNSWWIAVFPGCGIFVTTLVINLMGNALRDWLDPHMKL